MEILRKRCWWAAETDPAATLTPASAAIPEAEKAGDAVAVADLTICRGHGLQESGKLDAALADYHLGVRESVRLGDRELEAHARTLRGELYYYRGAMGQALEDLNRAYQLSVAVGDAAAQLYALTGIANVYSDFRVGQFDRAIEYYRQILAAHEKSRNLTELANTHYNIASTLERKEDLTASLEHYQQALALERQRGDLLEAAYVQRSVGIVLTKMGRTGEALQQLDAAIRQFDDKGDRERAVMTRLSRGITLRKAGRPAAALPDLELARRYYQAADNARFLEKVEEERALALAATGQWRAAYEARAAQLALERKLAAQLREEHTSRLRVQFDTEKKEQENLALARIRKLQTAVIILGALVIVILGLLTARHFATARRMRIMAMTDELTRLPNRRHFLLLAEEQVETARQGGPPFSLLALDVDLFKRINDTFGHETGDLVLRRVAAACRAALRHDDAIGRTGGEEFLAILPRTSGTMAVEIAERLRAAVEAHDWTDVTPTLHVTISIGISEWTPGDDFAALAKRADESLYQAKASGRNRIELAYA